jgi:hypothetical protein
MKPVLTKEWQTDKLTYQTDKAKAQSAQRDKGIKTYHTMHVNSNAALDGLFATNPVGSVFLVSLPTPRIILLLSRRTIEEGCISRDWRG